MKKQSSGAKMNGGVTGYAPVKSVMYPQKATSPAGDVRKASAVMSDFKKPTMK